METVTLKRLQDFGDKVNQAIEWALLQRGETPNRPVKPTLKAVHTSADAKDYSVLLDKWEVAREQYNNDCVKWSEKERGINAIIVEYIKDKAGLDLVPDQYRDKVYRLAYEDGHSSGYYEVYNKLSSLVEIFE